MLRRIPKVLLLVALLAAFAASISPAFGRSSACGCYIFKGERTSSLCFPTFKRACKRPLFSIASTLF